MNETPTLRMETIMTRLATATLFLVLLAALPQEPPPDIVVEVNGLSCPFCAFGIEKKFVERPEVDSVFVALQENTVHLWLNSGEELSDEEVRRTVDRAGFTPGEIRRPEPGGAPERSDASER
ncbi:MAG: heavy metal-associated domain-containing protein [Longimicrobiales bacterium]|nr:heavy metal-associated domain-containing protein [Longimicrobiales bacterium]